MLYNAPSGFKPRKTMKFTEIRIYLIFSISFFLILGMSAQNDLIFDKANADSIILTSNNVPPTAETTSIKPTPLFTNSNSHNLQIQSLNNATSLLDTSIIERNWTGSIPTFPTIMQAFKSQIKTDMKRGTNCRFKRCWKKLNSDLDQFSNLKEDFWYILCVLSISETKSIQS